MKRNLNYPHKHLSIRVPWHDGGWNGTICSKPAANSACLVLKNCAMNRNDERESSLAGRSIEDLDNADFPTCVKERGTFMSPFPFTRTLRHPYAESSPDTHGHLRETLLSYQPYCTDSVPYAWMSKTDAEKRAQLYDLDYDAGHEPTMTWDDHWIQQYQNQKSMLDCFFGHIEEKTSLVFFYAKRVPFVEKAGRVLIGVGRILRIRESGKYEGSNSKLSCAYWEHLVSHSIRPTGKEIDGFLLPYHEALEYAGRNPEFDPAEIAVMTPADKQYEFSYVSEHVASDTAIRVLMDCVRVVERLQALGIGDRHAAILRWIHDEVHRLEQLRGDYPGMGAALCAMGMERGHFVAASLINRMPDGGNPWALFEEELTSPGKHLPEELKGAVSATTRKLYDAYRQSANAVRLDLLHLLSRFDITQDQAKLFFVEEERHNVGIVCSDSELLANPYLLYEATRHLMGGNQLGQAGPIHLSTIDMGLYRSAKKTDLLPAGAVWQDPLDERRIRALTVQHLEAATMQGHTLLSRKQLITSIRDMSISPRCEVNADYYELASSSFAGVLSQQTMQDGSVAYQLDRLSKAGKIIRDRVERRYKASKLEVHADWAGLLEAELRDKKVEGSPETEQNARKEKAAALKTLAEGRISVLIGPAGTGKTTLLKVLGQEPGIKKEGILLLAPTGKARVRMEDATGMKAYTIAQFLSTYRRYDGKNQRYLLNEERCDTKYGTVVMDEASMLTEEMLASLFDAFKGVDRFILVGDHRQLPPIGAGRPFYDIMMFLRPDHIDSAFPRTDDCYAELTIKRRQGGSDREDMQLAEWFGGGQLEPAADTLVNELLDDKSSSYLKLHGWKDEREFERVFEEVICTELKLQSIEDVTGFNRTLGAVDGQWFNFRGEVSKVEAWQVLSPVRDHLYGVASINRSIHQWFRGKLVTKARDWRTTTWTKPFGLEEIIYGDKVINLVNHRRDKKQVYPETGNGYIANGEIGIVNGQMKRKTDTYRGRPKNLNVEFVSQKGYNYTFYGSEFGEEKSPLLELAYALTVHKAQGSEFGLVILVVPNPCFILTREMLYTALTRQRDRIVVLYQGDAFDIKALASPQYSDTLSRQTNLFRAPEMIDFKGRYLEKYLIHEASDGTLVRSKSELLVYQRLLDTIGKHGYTIEYEQRLELNEVTLLPDITIINDDTNEKWYWEHLGLLHDESYQKRWESKYRMYLENDILPLEEGGGKKGTLIQSKETPIIVDTERKSKISYVEIDRLIESAFKYSEL